MAWMKWIEKRNGAIGNFRAGQWVFTDAENDDKNCSFSPLTIVLTNPNFAWKMKKMKNKKHHLLFKFNREKTDVSQNAKFSFLWKNLGSLSEQPLFLLFHRGHFKTHLILFFYLKSILFWLERSGYNGYCKW